MGEVEPPKLVRQHSPTESVIESMDEGDIDELFEKARTNPGDMTIDEQRAYGNILTQARNDERERRENPYAS